MACEYGRFIYHWGVRGAPYECGMENVHHSWYVRCVYNVLNCSKRIVHDMATAAISDVLEIWTMDIWRGFSLCNGRLYSRTIRLKQGCFRSFCSHEAQSRRIFE